MIIFILFFVSALVFIINGLASGLSMDNASSIKSIQAESFFLDKNAGNRLDRSKIKMSEINEEMFSQNLQPISILMSSMQQEKTDIDFDVTLMATNPSSFLEPKIIDGKGLSKNHKNQVVLRPLP